MKRALIVVCVGFFSLFALGQPNVALGQSKADISSALDAMAASGQFSQAQIEAAKKELQGMSDQELESLVQQGMKMKDDPAIREKVKKLQLNMGK